MTDIKNVAVLGSGVMGAGIAAHLANAGVNVLLMDLPQKGIGKKNALAKEAIEKLKKSNPAAFMSKAFVKNVEAGNFDDDLSRVKDMDWVIEVVVERLDIKQDLYAKLEEFRGEHTVISSNTSTIPLEKLVEGRSDAFKKHFLITHFFNPPRYMRLLEIIKGKNTDEGVANRVMDFCDRALGKDIVECHDTPGFIANRIGTYWLQTALLEAIDQDMTVEEVDKLFARPMGIPKTGVFALMDLVGLDLMPLIGKSMKEALPASDAYVQSYAEPEVVSNMIANGYTGRKGKGGFYRLNKESGKKIKEAVNLKTGEYAPANRKVNLGCLSVSKQGLDKMLSYGDRGGDYAWSVLSKVLVYTASLVPEIADDVYAVDQAMKSGYNWKYGPFELIDRMGPAWFAAKLKDEGREVPKVLETVGKNTFFRTHDGKRQYMTLSGEYADAPRREGVLLLSDIKLAHKPVAKNGSAALWDIGDSVLCLEFTSKQNSIDFDIMAMIEQACDLCDQGQFKALVLHNEGTNFSVGANIGLALFAANVGMWDLIAELLEKGQMVYKRLKYSNFPVVAAPSGMALGGGCEVILHSNAVQAHAESYVGLVEVGVGLVPAWGGCKEMLHRYISTAGGFGGSMAAVAKVFEVVGTAQVAKSANEALEMKFFEADHTGITMNRNRLLADAKSRALSMVDGFEAPEEIEMSLPGGTAKVAMSMAVKGFVKAGKASPYDEEIAKRLAVILSGGDTDPTDKEDENYILKLERDAFMLLIKDGRTLARMESILTTGKPLRN